MLKFTNNWFDSVAKNNWDQLISGLNPEKLLEIGSYEGASTCYLIKKLSEKPAIEIHCIDTWEGGVEHQTIDMHSVESRFDSNTNFAISLNKNPVNLVKHKSVSDLALSKLLAEGKRNYFDFVYVDGSHQAPDVLFDAVASFRLTKIGGLIAFDDYLWAEDLPTGKDLTRCPKPAIDAFTSLYWNKIKIISAPLYQLYIQKISD